MPKKKESVEQIEEVVKTPRKRSRITVKKEDHVYQADTDGQGSDFDTAEQKKAAKKAAPAIFAVDPAALVKPRKNRGRPSKAYLQELAEYEARKQQYEKLLSESDGVPAEVYVEAPIVTPKDTFVESQAVVETPSETIVEPSTEVVTETPSKTAIDTPDNSQVETTQSTPVEFPEPVMVDIPEGAIKVSDDFYILRDIPAVDALMFQEAPTVLDRGNTRASQPQVEMLQEAWGVLDMEKDGSGYLRSADYNYLPSSDDIIVSPQMVRHYALHVGDTVRGEVRLPRGSEKAYVLVSVQSVNGLEPRMVRDRVPFESLTPLFPEEKFQLCDGTADSMSCRVVDLFSPIGKGQRALIVAPPKTGKTLLMKDVANAIARNHPESHLIMLLIDERPEEVTDMARTVNAEVIASTFDEPASQHVRIANIVLEKAKRLVECGRDVVIFLDSITRLARAYNTVAPASGKILSGGVEANALQKPKRFFGAARNIEGGGSLTIIATALIETGSKMDEVIFEEFKGTGNMELQLDRSLANKRVFPAVNLTASSTRRDELLLDEMTQNRMWVLRNYIADMNPLEAMKFLRQRLDNTRDNKEFIVSINS